MALLADRLSLRRRLLIWLALPMIALLIASGISSYYRVLHYTNAVYDAWLYDLLKSLAPQLEVADGHIVLDLPPAALRVYEWNATDTTFFSVHGDNDRLIAGSPSIPAPSASAPSYRDAVVYDSVIDRKPVRVLALYIPTAVLGERVFLQVAETTVKRRTLARNILMPIFISNFILTLIGGFIMWIAFSRGLSPLNRIAASLRETSHFKLTPIPDDTVPREILPLTKALNNLLERLDKAQLAQRRFVSDAAHQLRTPLSGLKLNIERASREGNLENVRQILGQLQISTDRASRLASQLLLLARAEPGAESAQTFEHLDLRHLARDVGSEWVPVALEHKIETVLVVPEQAVMIDGNPWLLGEALSNLIDNAIKNHSGGGTVTITVHAGDHPQISVDDDGPGISPAKRELVFERFQRGDRSNGEGAGLGLAIVREIASLHGATVSLHDGPNGRGLRVLLTFPPAGSIRS